MEGLGIFVIVVVAIGFIAILIYSAYLRQKFWRELAESWGFRYSSGDPLRLRRQHDFALFKHGHGQQVHHTVEGEEDGLRIVVFDYSYKTGSGKNQTTHHLSGLIREMPLAAPNLTVRPESSFDRFAAFFGFEDINFELEQFNRAFHVQCPDKKFAYSVFHGGMMEYLLEHRSLALEWQGRWLLVYCWSKSQFDRAKAEEMRESARGIAERLPEFLLHAKGD